MSNTQNVGLLLWLWLLVSGTLCTLSINRENPCIHLFFNSISRLWFELTWQLRILYTLEVVGRSTPFSFSFVALIKKTTLTILIFAARNATQTKSFTLILTQTYAMIQQIAVRDVRAVFHKGNVSVLKSLTVLYPSLLFEAIICRTCRKLIKVAL